MAIFDGPEFREQLAAMRQRFREQRASFTEYHDLLRVGLDSIPPTDPRYYTMRMTGSETAALARLDAETAKWKLANHMAKLNPRYGGSAPTPEQPPAE